jgi:hypothetical protein
MAAALVLHDADVPARGGRAHRGAPGSKAYGRLAILAQWRAEARIAMTLPPEAFTPPPKVRSAVVHLDGAARAALSRRSAKVLSRVVAAAFNQRRKMLRAALKGQAPDIEDRLRAPGSRPRQRAEDVPLEGFCALASGSSPMPMWSSTPICPFPTGAERAAARAPWRPVTHALADSWSRRAQGAGPRRAARFWSSTWARPQRASPRILLAPVPRLSA